MTMPRAVAISFLLILWACRPADAGGRQHEHHPAAEGGVGSAHFATSCAPETKAEFDRSIALLHSFWFPAAKEGFEKVLQADPHCAIAYWGIAMSAWGNPFGGSRSAKALEEGHDAIGRGRALNASDRERAYLAAAAELFTDVGTRDQRTRILAYENAMERLAARYPDDSEGQIFYALALDQSALPTDKTYAKQLKAAAILDAQLKSYPEHPGITHYIIHSYDTPALAKQAIEAARRYARIAPAVAHALHMPSHTFTRLGYWEDSIDTNIASARAAERDNAPTEQLHAYDYQVYAYLQTAQDAAAKKLVDQVPAVLARVDPNATVAAAAPLAAGYFAAAAIPARYALERGAWADAAVLPVRTSAFPNADALTYFARAIGTARSGDPAAAQQEIVRLASLQKALVAGNDLYWADQVDIQRKSAEAWQLWASGRRGEALALMREAADQEDRTDKAAVTPGPLAPARELLAEMLLESGDPGAALVAFEGTIAKEPNRFRAVSGAARAAARAGKTADAARYSAQLVDICRHADTERPELRDARAAAKR
jgi:hypothetical protein